MLLRSLLAFPAILIFLSSLLSTSLRADVVLNEIVADNSALGFLAANGEAYDWIELHNTGDEEVDLLVLRYPKDLTGQLLDFRAETSTDLIHWDPLVNTFEFESAIAPAGSSVAEVVHRSYAPYGTMGWKRYFRLVVESMP